MIQISLLFLILFGITNFVWCSVTPSNSSKAFSFRTSLHVARSLNPEDTENLSVKTKSGDLATIIVKKREGERNIRKFWLTNDTAWQQITPINNDQAPNIKKEKSWSPISVPFTSRAVDLSSENINRNIEKVNRNIDIKNKSGNVNGQIENNVTNSKVNDEKVNTNDNIHVEKTTNNDSVNVKKFIPAIDIHKVESLTSESSEHLKKLEPIYVSQKLEPIYIHNVESTDSFQKVEPTFNVQKLEPVYSTQMLEPIYTSITSEPSNVAQNLEPVYSTQKLEPISSYQTFEPVLNTRNENNTKFENAQNSQILVPKSSIQNVGLNYEEQKKGPITGAQQLEPNLVFGGITSSPYTSSEKTTRSIDSNIYTSQNNFMKISALENGFVPMSTQPSDVNDFSSKHQARAFMNVAPLSDQALRVPDPITITSSISMKGTNGENNEEDRTGRKLHVDPDGIPVITGIRVPDDESDRQVWRNARVINGILVPYAKNQHKQPIKGSQIYAHPTVKPTSAQWLKMEHNQKKPLSTIIKESGKWSEKKIGPTSPPPLNVMLIEEQDDKWQKLGSIGNQPKTPQYYENKFRPSPFWVRDDARESQDEDYVKDKILDYIKHINQQETNHRLVRKIGDNDAKEYLEEVSKHNIHPRESGHEVGRFLEHEIHPRAIQSVSSNNINSNYYKPPQQTTTSTLPPRVSFEGVRTPVLQYAHPELGVQPAKVVSTITPQKQNEEPLMDSRAQALAYFAHDIHADRSPFAFEPGLEEEARVQESIDTTKPIIKAPIRPKKNLVYSNQKYNTHPEQYHNKYNDYKGHPFTYKGYSGYYSHVHEPEKPMWRKISDTVKGHVQNGIEKVSNLTRPVVEPLVEATHKISQNLGLVTGNRDLNTFKEKVGLAGGSSILLPALGLVAGGAALGLGAVAVGRYLHMDVTHMRNLNEDERRSLNEFIRVVNQTELIQNITNFENEMNGYNETNTVNNNETKLDNDIKLDTTPTIITKLDNQEGVLGDNVKESNVKKDENVVKEEIIAIKSRRRRSYKD